MYVEWLWILSGALLNIMTGSIKIFQGMLIHFVLASSQHSWLWTQFTVQVLSHLLWVLLPVLIFKDFAVLVWSASHVCPPGASLSPEQCLLGVLFASPLLCWRFFCSRSAQLRGIPGLHEQSYRLSFSALCDLWCSPHRSLCGHLLLVPRLGSRAFRVLVLWLPFPTLGSTSVMGYTRG